MRIESQAKIPGDRIQKNMVENKSIDSFASVMKKSQSKLQLDALHQLMSRVDAQGEKLGEQRTFENLREYKNLVKEFMREALSFGLQLSDKQSFSPHGGMKNHQIVEVIDKKLIELQDDMLNNEKEGLDTLESIGEIKGLLINLYM
ncbi:YaaR family protein [Planococcus sp. CAU13]|uniref:YaaR family protein n=1 Tax=Planococcus sp. CAU13 TaxID=1541197 RepID=UPI0005300789|nr:YaaR family protein [Planococcus sp. CAU13]